MTPCPRHIDQAHQRHDAGGAMTPLHLLLLRGAEAQEQQARDALARRDRAAFLDAMAERRRLQQRHAVAWARYLSDRRVVLAAAE